MSEETKKIITSGLLLFAALAWLWPLLLGMQMEMEERKKRNEPPQYDERQRIARLRAGNHTLFVLIGFLIAWTAADKFGRFDWTGSLLDMTLCGLILAWCVWASECILRDAFTTWKDKRKNADALSVYYCGLILFWINPASGPGLCGSWAPFIFACAGTAALFGIVIYKAWKRKKTETGELL